MNLPESSPVSGAIHRALGWLAIGCFVVFLVILSGCTICPDLQCPVFPNAAPRQYGEAGLTINAYVDGKVPRGKLEM